MSNKKLEIIYSYSRAQAIRDGILIDLMEHQLSHLVRSIYNYPVAITKAVWNDIELILEKTKDPYQNYELIIFEILCASVINKTKIISSSSHVFRVNFESVKFGRKDYRDYKIVCGPGDDPSPVLTILLPNED